MDSLFVFMEAGLGEPGGLGPQAAAEAAASASPGARMETSAASAEEADKSSPPSDVESEEEDSVPECRICRGEAEEGRSRRVLGSAVASLSPSSKL